MNPPGGVGFEDSYGLRHRGLPVQRAEQMDVVGHPAWCHQVGAYGAENTPDAGGQPRSGVLKGATRASLGLLAALVDEANDLVGRQTQVDCSYVEG